MLLMTYLLGDALNVFCFCFFSALENLNENGVGGGGEDNPKA